MVRKALIEKDGRRTALFTTDSGVEIGLVREGEQVGMSSYFSGHEIPLCNEQYRLNTRSAIQLAGELNRICRDSDTDFIK